MDLDIRERGGGVIMACRVTPRASKNAVKGVRDGALLVSLAAPPVDGRANEALVSFLAEVFGVPKSRISIVKGQKGRDKSVFIEGLGRPAALEIIRRICLSGRPGRSIASR